jgi:hypothetical protein
VLLIVRADGRKCLISLNVRGSAFGLFLLRSVAGNAQKSLRSVLRSVRAPTPPSTPPERGRGFFEGNPPSLWLNIRL